MNASGVIRVGVLAFACAGLALAQNAGDKTGGPTRNDYRLHVMQPAEGSTVTGDRIQVIVDTEIPSERDTRQDVNSMPRPDVDVFVDGMFRETMRDEKNVVNVYNVQPGQHTIVLLALNRSREIIDRKEIHVEVVAPPVAQAPRPIEQPRVAPAPAPAYVPPPAPPAVETAPLPKTGTADPLLGAAGVALVLGGLALKRFL
jgi:LPXTG-motif cell wall-anchored protein